MLITTRCSPDTTEATDSKFRFRSLASTVASTAGYDFRVACQWLCLTRLYPKRFEIAVRHMKIIAFVLSLLAVSILWGCNRQKSNSSSWEPERESQTVSSNPSIQLVDQVVEASCGQCQFSMQGDSCDLAVRIEGVSYFVEGSLIDDHGDAHGDSGLCNCIRKAKVSGEVKNGRFIATSFTVLQSDSQANQE